MTRRLATDAKIVLERAGYTVGEIRFPNYLYVAGNIARIYISDGTVDNQKVVELLARRGFDEYGRKVNA